MRTTITKGKAILTPGGLRCAGPRPSSPAQVCNKLIAKYNKAGQLSGNHRCERCKQEIEVECSST